MRFKRNFGLIGLHEPKTNNNKNNTRGDNIQTLFVTAVFHNKKK